MQTLILNFLGKKVYLITCTKENQREKCKEFLGETKNKFMRITTYFFGGKKGRIIEKEKYFPQTLRIRVSGFEIN